MSPDLPKILVAGMGPLPPERAGRLYAPGIRVWGMARELAAAGHLVRLICGQLGEPEAAIRRYDLGPPDPNSKPHPFGPAMPEPVALAMPPGGLPELVAREAAGFGPDAAVGTTDLMCHGLAASGLEIPMWFDYNGDPMAERQLLSWVYGSDEGLADQWALVAPALARGDRFSGASQAACSALLGELATLGRLGRYTAFEPLVQHLLTWWEPLPIDIDCEPIARGPHAPQDAFLVIQTGGFNTWLDVPSMFEALERAMAANPKIHFAATGGAITGHHAKGFEHFQQLVGASPHRERYHFLGWLPLTRVPRLLMEADLALLLDLPCAEGRLGSRNRLFTWVLGRVPIIATPGCEDAEQYGAAGRIHLVPHGNPAAAAEAILSAAANPGPWRERAAEAEAFLREYHEPRRCLEPLLKWAASPKPASDLQAWRMGIDSPSPLLSQACEASAAMQAQRRQSRRLQWLERRVARLEGSRLVKLALWLRGRGDLAQDPPPEP